MKNTRNYEDSSNTSEEYETQYFGFGRNVLKNSLSSLFESKLQFHIESAKNHITKSLNLDEERKNKVSEKCTNLLQFTLAKSQKPLDVIFEDLDTFFHIPENILLPQDETFKSFVDERQVKNLKEEVSKWKSNILALDAAKIIMEMELAECEVIKKHLVVKEQQLCDALNGLSGILYKD